MKLLNKLFFGIKMTWLKVILFAVISAIVTAALLIIPVTKNTSFANIGVTFECWILFALVIIMNCEKFWEAGLKTFIFFLISQPLIYLLQVPFTLEGWNIFRFYPRWGIYTLLCFPAAMVAWLIKKNKWWGALILSAATGFLGYEMIYFLKSTVNNFPRYIVSVIFILLLILLMIFVLMKTVLNKIICGSITLAAIIAAAVLTFAVPQVNTVFQSYDLGGSSSWELIRQNGYIGEFEYDGTGTINITASQLGTSVVQFKNEDGEILTLEMTYSPANGLEIKEIK